MKRIDQNLLWDLLKEHVGHTVEIATYGDPDDPADICLEDMDTDEVILDAEIYTLCPREEEESESEESLTIGRQEIMTNDDKLVFNSEDEARKYAEEKVGKYDAEIGMIGDKRVLLASTGLPIEDRFRNRFEAVVSDFLIEMGIDPESSDASDCISYCGAELESTVLKVLHEHSDALKLDIICAGLDY